MEFELDLADIFLGLLLERVVGYTGAIGVVPPIHCTDLLESTEF